PCARVQREQKVRDQRRGDEVSHLGRARVQREHRDERQRDQRDLVADERDGLAEPEAAKLEPAQHVRSTLEQTGAPREGGRAGAAVVHARTILTSPLIETARTSTTGPSTPVGSASPSSSSELVSPLSERASTHTFDPFAIPTSRSPEAVRSSTRPRTTAPSTTSPDAVETLTSLAASRTETSPEALLTFTKPATGPSVTSPEAVLTLASPPVDSMRTSPLADFTAASSVAPSSTSPEADSTATLPNRPRPYVSAEAACARRSAPCGARTVISTSTLRRKKPRCFGTRTRTSWRSPDCRCSIRVASSSSRTASSEPRASTATSVVSVSDVSTSISPSASR